MGERPRCLGGSAAGVIYHVDDYRTEYDLYLELKGERKPRPQTIEMTVGKACEEGLATLVYPMLTGRQAAFDNRCYPHPDIPGLCATPDAFCDDRGLEIKTASYWARKKWGETFAEIPASAQMQVAYYAEFFDRPRWDVLALVAGEPYVYTYERDYAWGKSIVAAMHRWYERYIAGDEIPPIGGSKRTTDWLQEKYPNHRRPDIRPATEEDVELLLEFEHTKIMAREIKQQEAELANQVRARIGGQEGIEWSGGRVTLRKTSDKPVTDWERLAADLMDQYLQDAKERESLEARYTHVVEGYRKLVLYSEAYREAAHAA